MKMPFSINKFRLFSLTGAFTVVVPVAKVKNRIILSACELHCK